MKVVEVTWDDHAFYFGPYEEGDGVAETTTVGYLVHEDDSVIVLALSCGSDGTLSECQVIDKRMVRGKKVVRR